MKFKEFILEQMSQYRFFQDLDGVLVDFNEGWKKIPESEGLTSEEFEEKHGKPAFWKILNVQGKEWWSNLDWLPDGKQLWNYVKKYNPTVLSTPSSNPGSKVGKHIWIKRHLMIPENRVILSDRKHQFVKDKFSMLIDDKEKNINDWNNAGGTGILHRNAINTIEQLKKLGL